MPICSHAKIVPLHNFIYFFFFKNNSRLRVVEPQGGKSKEQSDVFLDFFLYHQNSMSPLTAPEPSYYPLNILHILSTPP